MSFGIKVRDDSGALTLEETGKYIRLVDSFNPHEIGVPSSKSYSVDVQATVIQGNSRILTVQVTGRTVSWVYSDGESWPEFGSPARIQVVTV